MSEVYTEVEDVNVDEMDQQIDNELKTNITVAIQTEVLKKLVNKVERSVQKKNVQEIYSFIYLDFQPNKITARAINNNFTTEAFVQQLDDQSNFKIKEGRPGSICFPADKLVPIVKRLKAKDSSITIQANHATFKSGRPEFELAGVDGSEFPSTPEVGNEIASISLNPNVLSMLYDRTTYAASTKETRPVLTGVHHKIKDNHLSCVATDSHRLAQYVYDLSGDNQLDCSVTIPTVSLLEVKKHLDSCDTDVQVNIFDHQVVYEFDGAVLYTRVLAEQYPNTDQLIFPSDQAHSTMVVQAGNFKNMINNATVYDTSSPILIYIKPELNQMRIIAQEDEVGGLQEDLSLTEGSGADVALAVNVNYLQEAFAKYGDEDYIRFEFMPPSDKKPSGMKPFKAHLNNGDPDCLELFVPVRSIHINYEEEVVIDDFQGVPEFEFNPFEDDYQDIG